jgi:carbon-monoxide dehydrogenase large subunit
MPGSILGSAVRRREDPRLVTGGGRFVDDLAPPGCLHAAFVRSSAAHARIEVDVDAARQAPGVVAVFTAGDLGLRPGKAYGVAEDEFARPPLASSEVRFAGEPVAIAIADSRAAAADAAQLVAVDYQPLPVAADLGSADLVAYQMEAGAPEPLASAEVVVRQRMLNQRLAAVPLETNALLAVPEGDRLTVYASTQSPHDLRDAVAAALDLDEERVRCVVQDVGGGFGAKVGFHFEFLVVAAAARKLGRPVKYMETRSENLVAMVQGRAQLQDAELGARRDGTLVGLRIEVRQDAGAYPQHGAFLPIMTGLMATGPYRIPAVHFSARSLVTNTTPTGYYRGAGRPEATALLERSLDLLAAELDLDPAELRRRNLLTAAELPWTTPTGAAYDSGDYPAALEKALKLAGYEELRAEQRRRREAGDRRRLLGIGLSTYVEVTAPLLLTEYASAEVGEGGRIEVAVGTASTGQGHETSFAMIAAERLGVRLDQVAVVEGDTDRVARGFGTQGSRSIQLGGSALVEAAEALLEQARTVAAERLEADAADIESGPAGLFVRGVPGRLVSWAELARAGLKGESDFFTPDTTYPFGAHVSVVEVDAETGSVTLIRHVAVDDCGNLINPLLAEGQVQGGIAQGIAQAIFEEVIHDAEGNPRTATLLDYQVPTCNEMPPLTTAHTVTPTPHNPLGAKGIGESGTIGSTPAVWNAVIDALRHLGVRHLDMPLTPEKVWAAANPR